MANPIGVVVRCGCYSYMFSESWFEPFNLFYFMIWKTEPADSVPHRGVHTERPTHWHPPMHAGAWLIIRLRSHGRTTTKTLFCFVGGLFKLVSIQFVVVHKSVATVFYHILCYEGCDPVLSESQSCGLKSYGPKNFWDTLWLSIPPLYALVQDLRQSNIDPPDSMKSDLVSNHAVENFGTPCVSVLRRFVF